MWSSRLIGALFLVGFLTYGTGSILVTSVVGGPDFLAGVKAEQTTLAFGALLMVATAAVDIGKAVFFYPVLEPHGQRTAVAYLATMVFEMAMMTVGVLALLMVLPLADRVAAGEQSAESAQALASLAVDVNDTAYQIGQLSLAFGCLFLCALLLRSRLIPGWLSLAGLIGYAVHMVGAGAEILGVPLSLWLLIPGALFEITLALWLIVRGFNRAAFGGQPGRPQALQSSGRWLRALGRPFGGLTDIHFLGDKVVLMRAVIQQQYGGSEQLSLADIPAPVAGPGDVVVRTRAAGVDRGTWHLMTGQPYAVRLMFGLRRPKHPVPGRDVAGVVAEVGEDVTDVSVGDEVMGTADGSFAELALVPQSRVAPKPDPAVLRGVRRAPRLGAHRAAGGSGRRTRQAR